MFRSGQVRLRRGAGPGRRGRRPRSWRTSGRVCGRWRWLHHRIDRLLVNVRRPIQPRNIAPEPVESGALRGTIDPSRPFLGVQQEQHRPAFTFGTHDNLVPADFGRRRGRRGRHGGRWWRAGTHQQGSQSANHKAGLPRYAEVFHSLLPFLVCRRGIRLTSAYLPGGPKPVKLSDFSLSPVAGRPQ